VFTSTGILYILLFKCAERTNIIIQEILETLVDNNESFGEGGQSYTFHSSYYYQVPQQRNEGKDLL
jgi:hypothetical protein